MDFDDIIIGSGLTGLATAIGLDARLKVLVLAGAKNGTTRFYDPTRTVPCAYDGFGGLGQFWHGVIPSSTRGNYGRAVGKSAKALFAHFYPRSDYDRKSGTPWLFVPRRAIRPATEWKRLIETRGDNLSLAHYEANRFSYSNGVVSVEASGQTFRTSRLWIAAGPLRTPFFLEASLGVPVARGTVSDHVISYLGQIDTSAHPDFPAPVIEHTRDGFWQKAFVDPSAPCDALLTCKPARFDYRKLDYAIEHRAAFGLPTGSAIQKIVRAQSAGLISEALFNRFGLLPNSRVLSVYAQVNVPDMHAMKSHGNELSTCRDKVLDAVAAVRPFGDKLLRSRQPEFFVKAIHLHHSVDLPALEKSGLNAAPVHIVDASGLSEIGPEHHSFFCMARAHGLSREVG